MQGYMLTIQPDGTEDGPNWLIEPPHLTLLQKAVGGYVEHVPYWTNYNHDGQVARCVAFCDEEGKLKGYPVNRRATLYWQRSMKQSSIPAGSVPDVLCGAVVVLWGDAEFMADL